MKNKKVTKYICETCKKESEDIEEIKRCEFDHTNEVYPIVLLNEAIYIKLKTHHIITFRMNVHDDTGKLANIELIFNDKETFKLCQPFSLANLDIY